MGYIEELRKLVGNRPLILVGAVCIMVDDKNRIFLQQRRFPEGKWGLPGGLMELGESTEDTARREVYEETGLKVGKLNLVGVHSGRTLTVAENGDQFYVVTIAYYTKDYEGTMKIDLKESIKFEYFNVNELPNNLVGSHRKMINDYLSLVNLNDWPYLLINRDHKCPETKPIAA